MHQLPPLLPWPLLPLLLQLLQLPQLGLVRAVEVVQGQQGRRDILLPQRPPLLCLELRAAGADPRVQRFQLQPH